MYITNKLNNQYKVKIREVYGPISELEDNEINGLDKIDIVIAQQRLV